jgi:hypothetical protein
VRAGSSAAGLTGRSAGGCTGWLGERDHGADELLVGSKWGYYYNADWQVETGGAPHEIKEHTFANLTKQTAESDALVGSHLDLYQIHSATRDSGVLEAADVLGELARLKADKGWRIGLTLSGECRGDADTCQDVRFCRYRFPATDLNSKATWFGIQLNQSATFAFNLTKNPNNLTIKSYNFNNKGTVDLSPTYRAPVF